jgi:NADH-quinone oxidoreductase subunit N
MSSSMVWILLPILAGIVLFFLRRYEKAVFLTGTFLALLLAWMAWKVPIAAAIELGPLSLKISDTMFFLGRRFILVNSDRPTLMLIYLAAGFWFGGSYTSRAGKLFVPLGLGIVALMTASLAVEPFLYAALLIQIAVLLCIPILVSPGQPVGRGALRFLIFQTLSIPFILFSGWLLAGSGVSPGELPQVVRASVLLAIGFLFLLAVFPFHTWLPLLAEESHPFAAAFVFFMLPGISSIFGLSFLERFAWLRNSESVYSLLLLAGAMMIIAGGMWAAFQKHLGRMMGYAVIVDIGISLIAIGISRGTLFSPFLGSLETAPGLAIFFTIFISRGFALGTWALALSNIRSTYPDLSYRTVQGMARKMPITAAALILAHFSMAGFPLLIGFPVRMALLERLAAAAPATAILTLLGTTGLLIGGLRALAVLVMGTEEDPWRISEKRPVGFLLTISVVVLVIGGLFPQIIR